MFANKNLPAGGFLKSKLTKLTTKKTSEEVFGKFGREETRTLTPKAPVPKTGASTIPPLVQINKKSW